MRSFFVLMLVLVLSVAVKTQQTAPPRDVFRTPPRPVHTFSIVARDPVTAELGVAVQSHWFSVGPIVPWVEAGVGAVATQSLVLVDYGPNGLELMRKGFSAPPAL